jgi:hypothetical protein
MNVKAGTLSFFSSFSLVLKRDNDFKTMGLGGEIIEV